MRRRGVFLVVDDVKLNDMNLSHFSAVVDHIPFESFSVDRASHAPRSFLIASYF